MAKILKLGTRSLRHVCPSLDSIEAHHVAVTLAKAMKDHNIDTPRRAAMFIAQLAHESGEFRYREEIWGPTAAQRSYAFRLGNNGPQDGYKYRGRGYIQITGKYNYMRVGKALRPRDPEYYVKHPDLLANYTNSARTAAWYWSEHGLNKVADKGGLEAFKTCTRVINGGYNGLEDRIKYWKRARRVARFLTPKVR